MLLSQLFLAYSDLSLFLAVIGVYVFFAALWLIYVVTERSERRIKQEIEGTVVDIARSNSEMNIGHTDMEQMNTGQMSNAHMLHEDNVAAYGQEITDLRSELTSVRNVAIESGQKLRLMQKEIDTLRADFTAHIDGMHSSGDVSMEITRVNVSDPSVETVRPELRLYNPLVESAPVENNVAEPVHMDESHVQVQSQDTAYDPELGLIYSSAPSEPDNLTRIWGVGAVNQDLLNENGIYFFDQVANWTEEHISKFNDVLCFRGRIEREDWVGQAKRLVEMKSMERRAA